MVIRGCWVSSLPLAEVAAVIEAKQGRRIADIQIIDTQRRCYSDIWRIAVSFNGDVIHYVVKRAGSRGRHQAELSRRADLLFAGDPSVASTELVYLEEFELTIGRAFSGAPLAAMTGWHPLKNPLRRYHRLRCWLLRTGSWLARYHAAARVPPGGIPLLEYVDNRRAALSQLPNVIRERLVGVASEPFEADFTIVHGDFTVGNILVDDEQLCVIDFGINEWTAMSAGWDVATLLISLQRSLLFATRSPVRWLPVLLRPLQKGFLTGYAGTLASRDLLRCLAVRHFTYVAQDPSTSLDVRTRWHFDHLMTILNELDRSERGALAGRRNRRDSD